MPSLNEADAVLALAQRFHNTVDAIARQAEKELDIPWNQRLDENVRSVGHAFCPLGWDPLHLFRNV